MVFVAITILIIISIVVIVVLLFLLPGLTGAPYVPTPKTNVEKALTKLYPIKSGDFLIDLGAGDGVVLYTATKHGARALGLEINPVLTLIAKWRFRKNRSITMKCRNFYHYDFPKETTVVYAFAVSLHIERIRRKIEHEAGRLGKPIYFISNAFDLKDLKPIKRLDSFYLYRIIPH
ncbi:hypothetical protein IKE98_03940 [Candidatus Saccharibacteria bacterium]|nr:hypothetical protein [Candidatus Saccharibacteria bacterium]